MVDRDPSDLVDADMAPRFFYRVGLGAVAEADCRRGEYRQFRKEMGAHMIHIRLDRLHYSGRQIGPLTKLMPDISCGALPCCPQVEAATSYTLNEIRTQLTLN